MNLIKVFHPIQPEWNELNVASLQITQTSPHFQSSIAYVYLLKTLEDDNGKKALLPGIPDGCIDLIFNLDGDYFDCLLVPSPKKRKLITFNPSSTYLGIRLFPLQDLFTFQVSLKEINSEDALPLFEVAAYLLPFYERLLLTKTFEEHLQLLESFLSTCSIQTHNYCPTILTSCIKKIIHHHGNLQVKDLERFSGYSERYLRMLFQNELGIAPKTFLQQINFQYIVSDIVKGEFLIENQLNENRYYDTSHFYKTFKKFTNMTPVEYQKILLKN
ncbi:MAG TPA: AraC family transcriptional regulator [Ureibacillus sp.]|nr:AraC family transcriptional regulator [Ureibacillus sp.]